MSIDGHQSGHPPNGYHTTPRLRVIIVGAGLSGLSAGIQAALSGHSVLILESTKGLGEVSPYNYKNFLQFFPQHSIM
jgi:thioredoxin reductase